MLLLELFTLLLSIFLTPRNRGLSFAFDSFVRSAGTAIYFNSLYTLYLAGTIWGFANGWAYVPPVVNLMNWFPNHKGFASGACIVGYGAAAMVNKLYSY